MSHDVAERSTETIRRHGSHSIVAVLAGLFLIGSGLWAMVAPEAFFAAAATFEPYNAHLIRDVGAFMLGIGAVLLLAAAKPPSRRSRSPSAAQGSARLRTRISHVIDRDHGGTR
jgi:uncharacterized protein YjeT (DUF2065 family)